MRITGNVNKRSILERFIASEYQLELVAVEADAAGVSRETIKICFYKGQWSAHSKKLGYLELHDTGGLGYVEKSYVEGFLDNRIEKISTGTWEERRSPAEVIVSLIVMAYGNIDNIDGIHVLQDKRNGIVTESGKVVLTPEYDQH